MYFEASKTLLGEQTRVEYTNSRHSWRGNTDAGPRDRFGRARPLLGAGPTQQTRSAPDGDPAHSSWYGSLVKAAQIGQPSLSLRARVALESDAEVEDFVAQR